MVASESPKRKPKKKTREAAVDPPWPWLLPHERQALREFVDFARGNPRLTWWEEYFLCSMNRRLYRRLIWVTLKQQEIIGQIKEKLHYDQPDVPLPPIDPDGIEENDDSDVWPTSRSLAGPSDDAEVQRWLSVACWDSEDDD
jgi:hypothetical protein